MPRTTPINTHLKSTKKQKLYFEKFFAGLILAISISLFMMALPRVRAALNNIPVSFAIDKINNKKNLGLTQLEHFIDIAKRTINIENNPHYLRDLSELLLYKARLQGLFNTKAIDTLKQTEQTLTDALAQSPANAYLWYRLASVQSLLKQPAKNIEASLLMSIMTGPSEAGFLIPRLNMCLNLSSSFSKETQALLPAQIIKAWKLDPNNFLSTSIYNQERLNLITTLLYKNPATLFEIRSAFEKLHH